MTIPKATRTHHHQVWVQVKLRLHQVQCNKAGLPCTDENVKSSNIILTSYILLKLILEL